MEARTDNIFILSVNTIKALTDLTKSTNLPRPSISDRLELYGLYNQAMNGDVTSVVMNNANNASDWKKYTAWLRYKGLTKQQARKEYAKTLNEILHNNYRADKYPELATLKSNLKDAYELYISHETGAPALGVAISHTHKHMVPQTFTDHISRLSSTAPAHAMPRSHSPAASLYRIASSGINSNMIRPPSRNQSFSKSRQNSISGKVNLGDDKVNGNTSDLLADISLNPSNLTTSNSQTLYNVTGGGGGGDHINSFNSSIEFVKWQGEINNTLLKISTELNNLKNQALNDAGHRPDYMQSEIPNYKQRSNGIDKDRVSSLRQYQHSSNGNNGRESFKDRYRPDKFADDGEGNAISDSIRVIYMKFTMFVRYLARRIQLIPTLSQINITVATSVIALVLLGLFRSVIEANFLNKRFQRFGRFGLSVGRWPSLVQWLRGLTGDRQHQHQHQHLM